MTLRPVMSLLPCRTQTVQGAQCKVQQAHHSECPSSLLPGWQGQRRAEKQDTWCMFSTSSSFFVLALKEYKVMITYHDFLQEMEKSEANNFLVLFRDAGCQFRSVYTYCPETEEITKLAGIGPRSITTKMIEGLYKYNSDRKQFSQIPAKTMSASVDAITIASHLWQTKKQGTPKKLHPK